MIRRVTVTLAGQAVELRIPVPSKAERLLASVAAATDTAAREVALVTCLRSVATDWPWSEDPADAWEAMWDAGVSFRDLMAAYAAWAEAFTVALGELQTEAGKSADTFRSEPDGLGDHAP